VRLKYLFSMLVCLVVGSSVRGDAMLQLFNLSWNEVNDKIPEIAEAGYSSLWLPPPTKGGGELSIGYDVFDPFDLGDKDQRGTVRTRYGTKEELQRMVNTAHRFGLRVYFDNIMNHRGPDVPGYNSSVPTNLYPGMVPGDFHLRVTSDGFYRNVSNIRDYNDVWQVQNLSLVGLLDIAQESPNANFGPTEGSTAPKPSLVRHPNNPEYYDMHPSLGRVGFGNVSQAVLNANPTFYHEDVNAYLIRSVRYLIDQTKCDGLRLDAVKHVPSYFFGQQTGADRDQSFAGYVGNAQLQFNLTHGFADSNQRNSNFDTETTRNDALIFGEHLGEPPAFGEYIDAGMRLLDNPLRNYLNNVLGNPSATLSGLDQRDSGGFSAAVRVMHAQSHDNDFAAHRELQNAYYFLREGVPLIYSDGYVKSPSNGGTPFPRHANAPYLGEFGDPKMPDLAYLHHQLARGGTRPRWSDNDIVAFERYDYREGNAGAPQDQTVVLFAMNDNYGNPGDISFDDGVPQQSAGTFYECFPVDNSRGQGLVVGFPPGSVLVQLADSPGKSRACAKLLVRLATNSRAEADATRNDANPVNRKVYVGSQTLAPGGGAVEFKIPSGGYVAYGYQWPEASRASLGDAIQIRQNGVEVPHITIYRHDGRDGDAAFNPVYPFRMRGSVDPFGNVLRGQNISNLTYAIDIPVVTNAGPIDILVRTDASTENVLVKLDGGLDLNSQMGQGPTIGFDLRDNPPGTATDLFLGYEQAIQQFRRGPEKFAATNIARNTVIATNAEIFQYTIGGGGSVIAGSSSGPNTDTQTAQWVFHNPAAPVTLATNTLSTQRIPLSPGASQSADIWVKVGYEFDIDRGFIYYTTDGSDPLGSFGTGVGSTRVAQLSFGGEDAVDTTIDWWRGTIPGQGGGTVRYCIGLFDASVTSAIPDSDGAKLYGQTRYAITNFNPQAGRVWLHNDLNTNSTAVGLEEGFHIVRARAFLSRNNKSSVFNTFLQTFYYDAQLPNGIIAFPATNGATLRSVDYEVVVRGDETVTGVEYNIMDSDANNDDAVTGFRNGNGLVNGAPAFARAARVSPTSSLTQQNPGLPGEFRFTYFAVPSNGTATITVRLREVTSDTFSNHVRVLTRTVNAGAPPQTLAIAFPATNGQNIDLPQNGIYTIVTRFTYTLTPDINLFSILIDGALQARTNANGTARYRFDDQTAGDDKNELRFDWSGMTSGQHYIQVLFHGDGLNLEAARLVNVTLFGVTDTDGDGLPDTWEMQFGLNPNDSTGINGPDGDPDMDGFTNLQEYLAGTNPRDENSLLRITQLSNGGRRISWQSVPGKNYQVYSAQDITEAFEPLSGPITAFQGITSYTNNAPVNVKEFYRVRVLP
jgi:glycosidase